ncbi:MAG: hypothetical protein HFG54_00575 [Lachnospiraceae bacterium]|jgi:hypothetical protein|nr:hypothetical protein [Lachnospiraceae bacterium]
MSTLQEIGQKPEETIHASKLLDVIAQWPEWKLQALCLDESDLKIRELIQTRRNLQHY